MHSIVKYMVKQNEKLNKFYNLNTSNPNVYPENSKHEQIGSHYFLCCPIWYIHTCHRWLLEVASGFCIKQHTYKPFPSFQKVLLDSECSLELHIRPKKKFISEYPLTFPLI